MNILHRSISFSLMGLCLFATLLPGECFSQQPPAPVKSITPITSKTTDLNSLLNVSDLTLEMAESAYKLNKNLKTLSDLSAALEAFLNLTCMKDLPRTLVYKGNPTDPICSQRMQQLLDLAPNNPVGICVRDGIDASSCKDAYQSEIVKVYNSDLDKGPELIDPQLKSGLPANDIQQLQQMEKRLAEFDDQYRQANEDADKDKIKEQIFGLYDKMLAIACRVSVSRLEESENAPARPTPDTRVEEVRAKLLKIPESMRPDYQEKMTREYEEQLARAQQSSKEERAALARIIDVIQNPVKSEEISAASLIRVRYILPVCGRYAKSMEKLAPELPQPVCAQHTRFSPQCVEAWRKYQSSKRKKVLEERDAAEKPASIISTF